jgi:hypothetical protein
MSHSSTSGKVVYSLIFSSILIIGGLLFFILPKEKISENEKRKLTPLPQFKVSSLQSGALMDSLDLYFSDNFIFRNTLISTANEIKEHFGKKDEETRIYTTQSKPKAKTILNSNNAKAKEETTTEKSTATNDEDSDTPYENIKSVIVYKNRAIQIFGGLNSVLKNYAGMVSKYKKELGPGINVYCMAVPVGSDFFLPSSFKHNKEKNSIDYLYSQLDPSVKGVRAYEELEKHQQEYIQFNTDHHWTGRAAYYAYTAFCKSAGFTYLPMNKFNRKVIHNFVGTLYYYTLSESLKKNKDSVEYFKIPNKTNAFYFSEGMTKARPTTLYAERARGGNSYGVFLGADFPLMRITSDVKNGRKILQIKDSYGNAFAPFLPSLYEEVFVVDYRYFNGSIKELVKKYGITDVVFSHNIFVINSSFTAKRENSMLNGAQSSKPSKEKVKQDTTTQKKRN